jgi:ADP-ribosylglycohydrolase
MQDKIKAAVIGSFIGDAMALGVHWVKNQEEIIQRYGDIDSLIKPELVDFHAGKEAGEFTHYGDQAYELLISVSTAGGFEVDNFMSRWRALFKGGYKDYIDAATRTTLDQIGVCESYTECVSNSSELGGASRIAPLLIPLHNDIDALRNAAIEQTKLTHNNAKVMESAAFFAEVAYEVLRGNSPKESMQSVIDEGLQRYENIAGLVKTGLGSVDAETRSTIAEFGMDNDVDQTLPATVHVIGKYENDFKKAVVENIMSGGDSAARGLLIGMVVGAQTGMNGIPAGWFEGLKKREELDGYVNQTMHKHYYDYTVKESY